MLTALTHAANTIDSTMPVLAGPSGGIDNPWPIIPLLLLLAWFLKRYSA